MTRGILFGLALFVLAHASARAHEPELRWQVVTTDGKIYKFYSQKACRNAARFLTLQNLNPSSCEEINAPKATAKH